MTVSIPGRDILTLLYSEAKRRPHIQRLIETVADMTDEEFAAIDVPMKWYRIALNKLREKKTNDQVAAFVLANVVDGVVSDPIGTMRHWTGGTKFIQIDRGGAIEVKDGSLIWFPDTGGVWIDTAFSKFIDHNLTNSSIVCRNTKAEYARTVKETRNRGASFDPNSVSSDVVEDKGLFKIYRI